MSYEAMHKVRACGLTDRTLVDVLDSLAFFLNQESGLCFPSTDSIARVARLSPNIVRRAVKDLETAGYISTYQKPGGRRNFQLHLERLPDGDCSSQSAAEVKGVSHLEGVRELTGVSEVKGVSHLEGVRELTGVSEVKGVSHLEGVRELTGVSEVKGVSEVTPLPCQKCDPSPVRSERGPLSEVTPEQGINKESNKEEEQGSLPAQAPWETDHLTNDGKKVEKPKATRAKPKTSCPFSPDDPIPPEYLEYAQAKHPSINAQTEFTKFVNFHLSKDNRYSNWLAAWRTWATKAEEFAKSRPQSQSYAQRNNKPLIFDDAYYGDGSF
jgi:hypothetical protein